MPIWGIAISTADSVEGCKKYRDVEFEVEASNGKEAIIKAVTEFKLLDGELFHTVHIGPPRY